MAYMTIYKLVEHLPCVPPAATVDFEPLQQRRVFLRGQSNAQNSRTGRR